MKRMSEGADQRDLDSSGQELGAASGQELGSSESNTEDIGTTLYIAPEVNRFKILMFYLVYLKKVLSLVFFLILQMCKCFKSNR